jgi:hypothetical protein
MSEKKVSEVIYLDAAYINGTRLTLVLGQHNEKVEIDEEVGKRLSEKYKRDAKNPEDEAVKEQPAVRAAGQSADEELDADKVKEKGLVGAALDKINERKMKDAAEPTDDDDND